MLFLLCVWPYFFSGPWILKWLENQKWSRKLVRVSWAWQHGYTTLLVWLHGLLCFFLFQIDNFSLNSIRYKSFGRRIQNFQGCPVWARGFVACSQSSGQGPIPFHVGLENFKCSGKKLVKMKWINFTKIVFLIFRSPIIFWNFDGRISWNLLVRLWTF